MLDRQGGQIVFECDQCPATLDTETRDFDEARAALKEAEWSSRKVGGEWLHFCEKCGFRDPRQRSMEL